MDFSFMDNEDFGLAKSFSTAPLMSLNPRLNHSIKELGDTERELE